MAVTKHFSKGQSYATNTSPTDINDAVPIRLRISIIGQLEHTRYTARTELKTRVLPRQCCPLFEIRAVEIAYVFKINHN